MVSETDRGNEIGEERGGEGRRREERGGGIFCVKYDI